MISAAPAPADPETAARRARAFWRRARNLERLRPYQFHFNNPRIAEAEAHGAAAASWLAPPEAGGRLASRELARALACLRDLQQAAAAGCPDPMCHRLTPSERRPGADPSTDPSTDPSPLATAAFLVRNAPGDRHDDQVARRLRTAYCLNQPQARQSLAWAIRFGCKLLEQNTN